MNRFFGWVVLVAAGLALCCTLNSYKQSPAAPPDAEAGQKEADIAGQLKEMNSHLKEINTLLHSGTLKVVVVINPERR